MYILDSGVNLGNDDFRDGVVKRWLFTSGVKKTKADHITDPRNIALGTCVVAGLVAYLLSVEDVGPMEANSFDPTSSQGLCCGACVGEAAKVVFGVVLEVHNLKGFCQRHKRVFISVSY